MVLKDILTSAVADGASDFFVIAGLPVNIKIKGQFRPVNEERLGTETAHELVGQIYAMAGGRSMDNLHTEGDDDFSFALPGISRFRVNAYKQRGSVAAIIRIVQFELPDPGAIGIPDIVMELAGRTRGLILVSGTAGSGKSTTQACMIDHINRTRQSHIITLEDPLEYLHRHQKSIVSQREITVDTDSYAGALRAALRQAPDVILLGEMRDHETISVAMTAAETGHLVVSTLHTLGAVNTIDRIIDAFPPNQQQQIRIQLSMVLQAVVCQQLLPTTDGSMVPAFEVLIANSAVRSLIRDAKSHQVDAVIQSSSNEGMISMDNSIVSLVKEGVVTDKTAMIHCINVETTARKLGINVQDIQQMTR